MNLTRDVLAFKALERSTHDRTPLTACHAVLTYYGYPLWGGSEVHGSDPRMTYAPSMNNQAGPTASQLDWAKFKLKIPELDRQRTGKRHITNISSTQGNMLCHGKKF